jgi:hypothetical protein
MLLITGEIVVGLAILVLLVVVALAIRRRVIQRGGSFDCSLRLQRKTFGRGWRLGVARYGGDRLEWFRVFSLSIRPRRVLPRDTLKVLHRREPVYPETLAVIAGHVVLECTDDGVEIDLAVAPDVLTGLIAWLEASPPGRGLPSR